MKLTPFSLIRLLVVLVAFGAGVNPGRHAMGEEPALLTLMPRFEDYTHMWWAEGFPSHTQSAPWRRCIQTGSYAMTLDTENIRIEHMGPLPGRLGYSACARADNRAWQSLPSADLELTIQAHGKRYRCTAGGKWTQFTGPRLIESGRFLQRADVTDLTFLAEDGTKLNVAARIETIAWPDRLTLLLAARPLESLRDASLEIRLQSGGRVYTDQWQLTNENVWSESEWHEVAVSIAFPPNDTPEKADDQPSVTVEALELTTGAIQPVAYDPHRGWHRVNLDRIAPIVPQGDRLNENDAIERVRLVLKNPDSSERIARLLFEKKARGIRVRIGSAITGISAMLRDVQGNPTGIPVQLSKNWHTRPEGGVYSGAWFHGITQVRIPPGSNIELELTLVYGHWGGVAAASHAQLCLIGWGSNQLWDQSALGSWGESICYEPDQVQGRCAILDARPVMVRSLNRNLPWSWTHNVGGGDFFRLFDVGKKRLYPARMRTAYLRYGPCLTEVVYAGCTGQALEHSATVSLARSDDLVRGVYRLRMDVNEAVDFSRLAIFQIGADTYSPTSERTMAMGNETGRLREWDTQWGGDTYRTSPMECTGRVPWISLHNAVSRIPKEKDGAWANRGVVIRAWDARLGGQKAAPWVAEYGVKARGANTSTIDLVPPPGITRLEPGDYVEATLEHIIMPQFAKDYYGPNVELRNALDRWENTWHMIHREATGNDRRIEMILGTLESRSPAVRIETSNNRAEFSITGGLGYVPITFTGLTSYAGYVLELDGKRVDQSVHGNDFWQTDYDPATQQWETTFTLPRNTMRQQTVRFGEK